MSDREEEAVRRTPAQKSKDKPVKYQTPSDDGRGWGGVVGDMKDEEMEDGDDHVVESDVDV